MEASTILGDLAFALESRRDRAGLLVQLANLPQHPESVPINMLVRVAGTPSADAPELSNFEFIRTVAIARILMPGSFVRLSAGREKMPDEAQAMCFMAGANSIFCGDKLLTTPNPEVDEDARLFAELGLQPLVEGIAAVQEAEAKYSDAVL